MANISSQGPSKSKSEPTFLSLPAELRNRIYELAVLPGDDHSLIIIVPALTAIQQEPNLTKANRQLRSEVLPVYYGGNTFCYRFGIGEETVLEKEVTAVIEWLKGIGVHGKFMMRLEFVFMRDRALDVGQRLMDPGLLRRSGIEVANEAVKFGVVRIMTGIQWIE